MLQHCDIRAVCSSAQRRRSNASATPRGGRTASAERSRRASPVEPVESSNLDEDEELEENTGAGKDPYAFTRDRFWLGCSEEKLKEKYVLLLDVQRADIACLQVPWRGLLPTEGCKGINLHLEGRCTRGVGPQNSNALEMPHSRFQWSPVQERTKVRVVQIFGGKHQQHHEQSYKTILLCSLRPVQKHQCQVFGCGGIRYVFITMKFPHVFIVVFTPLLTGFSGGHYSAGHTTARTNLKLSILFVLMCCFNYLHPHFARSGIHTQFMREACPSFRAPHHFMFGRIVKVVRMYQEQKIIKLLHSVHKEYGDQPYASTSVDLWTSKHSAQGYAAMDIQFGNPFDATISAFTLAVKHIPGAHDHTVLVSFIEAVSSQYVSF